MSPQTARQLFPIVLIASLAVMLFSITSHYQATNKVEVIEEIGEAIPEQELQLSEASKTHDQQEQMLRLQLLQEFENAFIKQYTAPIGCQDWQNDPYLAKCINHEAKAKLEFQQEFIEQRGLPRNTFDKMELSQI